MHAIKWLVLLGLVVTNTIQIFFYLRVKKVHRHLPIVEATITRSELMNFNDSEGKRIYEARIEFKYEYGEREYQSNTPVVKSLQLFPAWNYEQEMLAKYRVGEKVDVRVVPNMPDFAYIEVAPFSFVSAVVMPLITAFYAAVLVAYGWGIWILAK